MQIRVECIFQDKIWLTHATPPLHITVPASSLSLRCGDVWPGVPCVPMCPCVSCEGCVPGVWSPSSLRSLTTPHWARVCCVIPGVSRAVSPPLRLLRPHMFMSESANLPGHECTAYIITPHTLITWYYSSSIKYLSNVENSLEFLWFSGKPHSHRYVFKASCDS